MPESSSYTHPLNIRTVIQKTMPFFTTDVPCPSCGYNLRGLSLGHGCPECGLKVVSAELTPDERNETRRIDAEIEQNLRQMEEERDRNEQITRLLAAWEHRGNRFDRVLDRIEKLLDRYNESARK